MQCTYPQSFKRGFPEGYLAGLEHRLAETERALFNSLQLLRGMPESDIRHVEQVFHAKRTKSTRTKEWERLPLNTQEQRWQWFNEKASDLDLRQLPESAPFSGNQSTYPGRTPVYGLYQPASFSPATSSDVYWHGQSHPPVLSSGPPTGGESGMSQPLDHVQEDTRSPVPSGVSTRWQTSPEIAHRPSENLSQRTDEVNSARLLSERLSNRFF